MNFAPTLVLPGPIDLSEGERLVLAALRAWARCRADHQPAGDLVRKAIAAVASDQVGALFAALMEALEGLVRRPLRLHAGVCPGYADDEQRLVLACGVSLIEPEMAARLLAPMARDPEVIVCFARALNAALNADGLALPVRLSDEACSPTLH